MPINICKNMRLFFASDIGDDVYTFNAQESKHISKVLRFRVGDKLLITDGKGFFYTSEITDISPKACVVKVIKKEEQKKHDYYLHVAMAPTKNIDRFEWFLEKATELGIDEITPILTHNSERKNIKLDRLRKVIEAAMKQSYKAHHPKLNDLTKFDDFIAEEKDSDNQFIAHCYDSKKHSIKDIPAKTKTLILIGPEGDFTEEEIEKANHFKTLSLGEYRLRTETAGIAAVAALALINQ
jgi:16S rRNA (uracil1498-N3)-methyltransferase